MFCRDGSDKRRTYHKPLTTRCLLWPGSKGPGRRDTAGPFRGVPRYFEVEVVPGTSGVEERTLAVAQTGGNDPATSYPRKSRKLKDAVIMQAAQAYADIFVSEDLRCRERLEVIGGHCRSISYDAFRVWLLREGNL